jgi:hypothetical protein
MAQTIAFGAAGVASQITGSTSLTPAPEKKLANENYLSNANYTFAQQYLPDLYEKEFERYGNRSIASFLRMVSAELPTTSDLIKWSEQGRLHVRSAGSITDGNTIAATAHNFRTGQTVVVIGSTGVEAKCYITDASAANSIEVAPYATLSLVDKVTSADGIGPFDAADTVKLFVYGSEFGKGTAGMVGSLEADFESKENNPIIIKDKYEVSGSEMAHVGWVEVTTENGASGYLWYLKSEHETRLRFEDYLEMSMIEGEPAIKNDVFTSAASAAGVKGTKGMFFEIEENGNTTSGVIDDRDDLEAFAKVLDKEGAIQENVLFVNRSTGFDIDRVLAAQNNSGASTSSYGLFDNDEDMALNLGFTGFRIGYDFYKSDWKYLNDAVTRGGSDSKIDGVLVPAGTTTVYDQVLGQNAKRPFLHVRYRQSAMEDRKYKSWVVGSAGGAATSDKDNMEVHFLSERALCVMGANNFMILK